MSRHGGPSTWKASSCTARAVTLPCPVCTGVRLLRLATKLQGDQLSVPAYQPAVYAVRPTTAGLIDIMGNRSLVMAVLKLAGAVSC
jgi:hypothetical protein